VNALTLCAGLTQGQAPNPGQRCDILAGQGHANVSPITDAAHLLSYDDTTVQGKV